MLLKFLIISDDLSNIVTASHATSKVAGGHFIQFYIINTIFILLDIQCAYRFYVPIVATACKEVMVLGMQLSKV